MWVVEVLYIGLFGFDKVLFECYCDIFGKVDVDKVVGGDGVVIFD